MKKFLIILFSMLLICQNAHAYRTADKDIPVDIVVNGSFIKMDERAFVESGRAYVPIRFVSEALGVDSIEWNDEECSATIKQADTTIKLFEDKNYAYINDEEVQLDANTPVINGRLFVPVRFVGESLGANVDWDKKYYNVLIDKDGVVIDEAKVDKTYTNDEVLWLARIIHAESEGEPARGKIGVGNVVLNRVASPSFPNTIYDVIFDRKNGVQFQPIMNGAIYNIPSNESVISAKRALRGENTVGNSLYFFNPRIASSNWIARNRKFYISIKNHDFYL
ncbi:MAG: copper amine oxidase [Ruminococcaceae bacterium]|nr:copper amine oxidase [Oscillospiraceae bacterium]